MPNYTSHVVATPSLETDVECLRREILPLPPPVDKPCMAVLSGLPGSGKTTFARNLAARVPLAILESDALRKALFTQPSYSANESRRLFGAIHQLAYELLLDGNLGFSGRHQPPRVQPYGAVRIGGKSGRPAVPGVCRGASGSHTERLERRALHPNPQEASTADWRVYRQMAPTVEPILRPHLTVDTSEDVGWALAK